MTDDTDRRAAARIQISNLAALAIMALVREAKDVQIILSFTDGCTARSTQDGQEALRADARSELAQWN